MIPLVSKMFKSILGTYAKELTVLKQSFFEQITTLEEQQRFPRKPVTETLQLVVKTKTMQANKLDFGEDAS